MSVTLEEAHELLPRVQCFFDLLVSRYEEAKYPADEYQQLLECFSQPHNVGQSEIERALRWKYARPQPQAMSVYNCFTIERLAIRWPDFFEADNPQDRLAALGDSAFVSRVFLLHLTQPEEIPIIDRFNHRAVRWFLTLLRPGFKLGYLPRKFEDVQNVQSFICRMQEAWGDDAPTSPIVDRFLMMFGKYVAPRY